MKRILCIGLFALAPVACTTAPVGTIPDPLPETLEWAMMSDSQGAFLGLKVRENDSGSLDALTFDPGVRVTRVIENSPARTAGIAVGDVVLSFDGADLEHPRDLEERLRTSSAQDVVALEVRRGDAVFGLEVTLAAEGGTQATQAPELLYRVDPARSQAGWLAGRGGVVLVSSPADGPFPAAGVGVGSVVRAIDGEAVQSEQALIRRLAAFEPGARVNVDFESPEGGGGEAKVKLLAAPTRVTKVSLPVLFTYAADPDRDETRCAVLDLWFISLFRYRREGGEREWRFLRFLSFAKGVGDLTE